MCGGLTLEFSFNKAVAPDYPYPVVDSFVVRNTFGHP